MSENFSSVVSFSTSNIWKNLLRKHLPLSFELEVTARCNNSCRHCYINLPAGDEEAKAKELSSNEIRNIAADAVSMGASWCSITGGEPLLRDDFLEIYQSLKRLGLLVTVFTNGCLITDEHVDVFRRYPPVVVEVSVYGVTKKSHERVTRTRGSYEAFINGLNLLQHGGIKARLKAMAMRSNLQDLPEIARFCRKHTADYFRWDPMLHLRYDGDLVRNREIQSERLSPEEIAALERMDKERFSALLKDCDTLIGSDSCNSACNHLFTCGAGIVGFTVSYDGIFRLCSSLWHPDCLYDLRKGSLHDAWNRFVPKILEMKSENQEYVNKCLRCNLRNLSMCCPAHSFLECKKMDSWNDYFCDIAHARAGQLILQHSGGKFNE
jgi:MoaA/NifB/PqqE/SkfB family radical SAM enzyme